MSEDKEGDDAEEVGHDCPCRDGSVSMAPVQRMDEAPGGWVEEVVEHRLLPLALLPKDRCPGPEAVKEDLEASLEATQGKPVQAEEKGSSRP